MKTLKILTKGIATREIKGKFGTIKKGTRVKIIRIDSCTGYDLTDGVVDVTDTGFDSIIPDINEDSDFDTLPIGATGVTSKEISGHCAIFKKGTRVTVTGISIFGYDLKDDRGIVILDTGINSIIPDIIN